MFNKNLLKAQMALKEMTGSRIAKDVLKVDESTFYRKMQTGEFTRTEINLLIEALDIEDPMPIFFAD